VEVEWEDQNLVEEAIEALPLVLRQEWGQAWVTRVVINTRAIRIVS